jgi:hypothetical protein
MQVYGYRPFQDEPDPRPLPEEPVVQSALTAMFDAMFEMLGDTTENLRDKARRFGITVRELAGGGA